MVLCPYLYTGNPHILTSIYSGTATNHLSAKFSVIQTLSHRASTVCSNPELLQKEKDHLRKALTKCKYPKWALDKMEKRLNRSSRQVNDGGTNNSQAANHEVKNKGHIVIPYTQGLCESIKKICGRYGIQTHFKGGRTIKNLLVSPKDPMVNQSGAIYWYQCGDLSCDDDYIGETSRTFGERYKEHLKPPLLFITMVTKQAIPLTKATSK